MLAGLEGRQRLRSVIGNRRVDVDGIDVGIFEQIAELAVADLDAKLVAARSSSALLRRQMAYISASGCCW